MERHGETATQGTQAQRVDLGVDEVLDAVPAEGPSEAGNVDEEDGALGCGLHGG